MAPNRIFNFIITLALAVVTLGCFYYLVEKVSAGRSDPAQFSISCSHPQTKQLLYHRSSRSAKGTLITNPNAATRHLLYHRSVKSCYPAAK